MRPACPTALLVLSLFLLTPIQGQPPPRDPLADDPRLSPRVLLHVEGLPVGDLLAQVREKTGVALAASAEVADEKVMIFGPARPLREQLADMAALLNTTWERKADPGGQPRYTLTRSLRARQLEARLSRSETERMLARLEEQVRALDETPRQLERRPKDDPLRARLSDPRSRLGTRLYACLTPPQKELLFSRQRIYIPYTALNAGQKQELGDAFRQIIAEEEEFAERQRAEGFGVPVSKVEDLERNGLLFKLMHSSFVQVMVVLNRSPSGALLVALMDRKARWPLPAHGDPYTGRPVPSDAVLPEPKATAGAAEEKAWPDQLRRLAQESGQPLLADYYRVPPQYREGFDPAATVPTEAEAALDRLCQSGGYLWWTRGRTLLFRKRDFYSHRRLEVPDRWLLAAIDRLKARGGKPTYADVGRAAELTPDQVMGLDALAGQGGLLGVEPDRLPSLRLFLSLVQLAPDATGTPVHALAVSRDVLRQISLTYPGLSPAQRRLVPLLLAEEARPLPPEAAPAFSGYLLCPRDETVEQRGDYRFVRILLTWDFNKSSRGDSFPATVSLPMSLPDDRRSRTRIEIE